MSTSRNISQPPAGARQPAMKISVTLAAVIAAILVLFGCQSATARAAPASSSCPAGQPVSCIQTPPAGIGQELVAALGPDPGTPWLVTDPSGAPMAWINLYGLYSGGDGGKMPGGLICVTNGVTTTVACLTPVGTLQLQDLKTGIQETLTPHDIRFTHCIERHRLAYCRNRP